ncbi:response regulator [Microvirga sp. 2TAF3]|uniref:response regulator n=1 Tax=Microvirga sp. 2TAF3 TaxID=3233014 RepID=UPI003F95E695
MNQFSDVKEADIQAGRPPGYASSPVSAKILVVDDDSRNLLAVKEMLGAPGVEVVTAESGEAALRLVLKEDFAVILLDVQMPGIDGYEVAGMIRARHRSSRVPILFLTAYNKDDLQVFRGYSAGAVDYVFKPIEPLILKSKVDVFVDLHRKTEEIRRQGEEERRLLMENLQVRSEKLKTEQMLRRREEHQSIILGSLPMALFTASLQEGHRRLHFTNENIEAITGFKPQEFLARTDFWSSRLHPEDRDRVLSQLADLPDLGSVSLEYRWKCADGTDRYFLDHTTVVRDEDDNPRETFGMWFDITDRKQLEQNLLHASKLEAVGRLTGGIAHDFNNMLSVVIGNLDLLQKSIKSNERARKRVKMALDGAQRCADLTHRLLVFSRREPLQAMTIDVGAVMPNLLDLMRRTLGERIRVQLKTPEAVWPIRVDQAQLEAALLNLAVNARDAMPNGGDLDIEIENCSLEVAGQLGDHVVISVTDKGTGMPAHVLERVFEPFFTTKETGKGTGLGLSMVYGFVKQSGGHIEIDSEPGEGTSIRLILPRVNEEINAPQPDDETVDTLPFGDGQAALVVEDDSAVRAVAVSTLRSLGFEVAEAETADKAVEMLKARADLRLVLSDVRMPGQLSGIELAGLIKREYPNVQVLLTTGYVEDLSSIGELDLLYKPYRAANLAQKIQCLLSQFELTVTS